MLYETDTERNTIMSEDFTTLNESDFAASAEQFNTAPINLARMGSYVRTSANSTQTTTNSTWISDLTNNTTNPSFSFAGVVHEVIVFDRTLTDVERQNVYGYLARKYRIDGNLPDSIKTANTGTRYAGLTYWQIEHHPNSKGFTAIPADTAFGDIGLQQFLNTPEQAYRSKGTPSVDGTTLANDTYTIL